MPASTSCCCDIGSCCGVATPYFRFALTGKFGLRGVTYRPRQYRNPAIGPSDRLAEASTPKAASPFPREGGQAHTRLTVRCAGFRLSSDWRRMPDSSNYTRRIEGLWGSAADAKGRSVGGRVRVRECGRDPRPRPVGRVVEAKIVQQLVRDRVWTGLQRSGRKKVLPPMATPLLPIQLMP